MSSTLLERARPMPPAVSLSRTAHANTQWAWLAAGLALAFAIPYLLADRLSLDRDVYYGVYAASVFGFFALWLRFGSDRPRRVLARNWRLGLVLGAVFAGVETVIALTETATRHPAGWTFVGAIVWRGVVYGAADGLLLSVFPILAVFAAFAVRPLRERTKRAVAAIGSLALAVSVAFTAVYHLGYADFRGSKLRKPVAGDLIWSVPTLATLSPVGAPVAHVGLHVAAVFHTYDTDTFLPPHHSATPAAATQRSVVAPDADAGTPG